MHLEDTRRFYSSGIDGSSVCWGNTIIRQRSCPCWRCQGACTQTETQETFATARLGSLLDPCLLPSIVQ